MTIIAFDTSTPSTVVAVESGGKVSGARLKAPAEGPPAHSAQLLEALSRLLDEAGAAWSSVERIGVGAGPGTFTGLRISSATAEGLRRPTGASVVPVGSLDALALPARRKWPARPVCAVIDARRGELFAAGWAPGGEPLFAPRVVKVEEVEGLFGERPSEWMVVGEAPDRFEEALGEAGIDRPASDDPLNLIDGAALCELARSGSPQDGPLLPDYLRDPDARRRES